MKEKIETINFKYKITIFTFILFLIISSLAPISGDDWKSYIIGKEGFIECFKNININDGRIISGFLINFLTYNKLLFDISLAILMSKFVKICNDLMGTVKNKYYYFYPLIGILLVSTFMFSYNYVSITSTVAYTFPTIFIFNYYYLLLKDEELKNSTTIKLILISLFVSLSSIHLAITFFITNLIYFTIYSKKKKINAKYFILVLLNFIAIIYSLSQIKTNLIYIELNNLPSNISYIIDNVFSKNIVLIILGAIPINLYLSEKLKEHVYGRVVITLFDLILIFSLSYNFFNYIPVNINLILTKYNGIFATENWYYVFYFIVYLVLFVLSINHYITNRKLKLTLNTLMIFSFILMIITLLSPIIDKGNIIFIILVFILITTIFAKEAEIRIYEKLVKTSITLLVIYYISMFGIIKYIDYTRETYINEQLKAGDTNIEIKANPLYLVWRYNPDYFQSKDFKKYYNISEDKGLEVKYFGIFEKIEKRVK